jgi:integrase
MARGVNKLGPAAYRAAMKKPGMHGDGGGLWLHVGPTLGSSWIYRFMLDGRAREMGLGPTHTIGLAEARDRAKAARLLVLDGKDPLDAREAERQQRRLEAAKAMTFRQCAEAYIAAHKAGWRNPKHAAQWPATLEAYAYPVFGDLPVQAIDTDLVMKVIGPIWQTKTETASRLRGRIELVLDWATASKFRSGDNPARWGGNFAHLLPAKGKVAPIEHHPALAYAEMGAFMVELRAQDGISARALEFTILTAARTGEVIGATWGEINLAEAMWIVPAERMKAGREHRVPLAGRALEILGEMAKLGACEAADFVFPGRKEGTPLSNMVFLMLLRRMGRGDLTGHGFRSTFRDWAAERSSFPAEVAEMALAHTVADRVEAAYRRGDLFQKRRQLAEAWARFCASPATGGTVTAINGKRAVG